MPKKPTKKAPKQKRVAALKHDGATRRNIPTAELQSTAERMEEQSPFAPVRYRRANPLADGEARERDGDVDPQILWNGARVRLSKEQIEALRAGESIDLGHAQLAWRGKDAQDWSDLVVQAPPVYVQEKIHPRHIIENLKKQTRERRDAGAAAPDMFADFNGIDADAKTEFYQHDQNWQNRMILGDSLHVMASLAERESLRGQVQCIYFDPPYGIKFNSNWQVSTRTRDVRDGKLDQITREPEQVKAFRDTWKDGIHSYLTYLRDRLTVMRDLLSESGSIFVQIGDENVHRVRALMDEVFGEGNFVSEIIVVKSSGLGSNTIPRQNDFILWFAKSFESIKIRKLTLLKQLGSSNASAYVHVSEPDTSIRRATNDELAGKIPIPKGARIFRYDNLTKPGPGAKYEVNFVGKTFTSKSRWWGVQETGMHRAICAGRVAAGNTSLSYIRFLEDSSSTPLSNVWLDTATGSGLNKIYVVQTTEKVVQRCILMATDPGDLVLDPTCGSGTTATVAEQWGRRWITIDTSRVSLALARARMMGVRYPYYHLTDTAEGRKKEQDVSGQIAPDTPTYGDIRQGFVYERVPHITLKTIVNNAEIDVIWDTWQQTLAPLRQQLNSALGEAWEEWEIPRAADDDWAEDARKLHAEWWAARIERQREIDRSIAQKAPVEYLYDKPYEDTSKVRVAGPFTVESLSPHRVIPSDESELIHDMEAPSGNGTRALAPGQDFASMVLENLKSAGVQQSDKQGRINFTAIEGWPGDYIAATGIYEHGGAPKKAGIFIGPEFGSIIRADLMAAARQAHDARFDVLVACGFNFDAHTSEISSLGLLPILKARMNPDLHMADDLKNTGAGNLFIVFGEPDIEWHVDDHGDIVVEVLGIDVFDPKTGEIRASGKDDIAAWFIDTDYNEESFFVRHAYFMGANDPYKQLKTSLKAEIDQEAWATLNNDKSRPFPHPQTNRFAVKVINHFGDEVMKVFGV